MNAASALKFYQDLVEHAQALVFECDREGRFTYLNPAWESTLGYRMSAMLGHCYSEFQHPDTAKRDLDLFTQLLTNGHVRNLETTYISQSGSEVHLSFSLRAIQDSEGNIECTQGMAHDITSRIQMEKALKASEEKYRLHVENSFDVLFTLDLQGNFVYASPAWERHFGFDASTLVGKPFIPYAHPDDVPLLVDYLQRCLSSGKSLTSPEYRVRHADGRWIWFVANGTPFVNSQGEMQYIGVAHDITQERQGKETIAERSREMERLTYVASHDLRAPLLNIDGFTHLLRSQIEDIRDVLATQKIDPVELEKLNVLFEDEIPSSIGFISAGVAKMDSLIQGLLQVSRVGRLDMKVRLVDMNELLNAVLENFRFQLQEIGAHVAIVDLPPCYGDTSNLNQLFANLIGNAIKYRAPERPLELSIYATTAFDRNCYVIKDNGMGISPTQLESVWNVFYRVDPHCKTCGEGLGLSIVRSIATRHQGKAWADSESGKGSSFYVELPSGPFTVSA